MNGIQNHKTRNLERPYPGCLGRVVSLFDLSAGMPGNRLLMDKPHRDGSALTRSHSDVSGLSLVEDQIQDKLTISELQSTLPNGKSHGTPIKMLIAQEMSKEVDSKQKPPSVVARLMGLDSLPLQQSYIASQRNHSRGSSRSQSCASFGSGQEEQDIHQYPGQNGYKDVYEIQQPHNKYVKNKSPQKEIFDGNLIEKKMALVRQNFIELKRLSTDEKLRQSKQFQDALEVLSSNKDSFLNFLQEPNSMFSQQLSDLQSTPLPSETKRITILKPANMVDSNKVTGSGKKDETQIDKISQLSQVNRLDKSTPGFSPPTACKLEDSRVQATRIVVLKPSSGKSHDIKAVISPHSLSPKALHVENSRFEDNDAKGSRDIAKEINQKMCEDMNQQRRDETLLSSVFSNGYTGDESSFDKSETEFAADNLSDSEAMSPISRHSWDYINRLGSPYSLSTFSRASYSPESSVCREAKRRLSERWAMMASNGSQEQKQIKRSSSTLGEMLALSDLKRSVIPEEDSIRTEQEFRGSTSCFTSDLNDEDRCDTPARNILRSKSVPASSTAYSNGIDSEVSDPKMEKTDITKELTKTRSMKSLLKGRVSNLFFSRTNKSSKQKSNESSDESHETKSAELPRHPSEYDVDIAFREGKMPDSHGSSNKASPSHSFSAETKEGMVHTKAEFSATKPCPSRNPIDNPEQPSSIPVLESPFQEDDHREPEFSDNFSLLQKGFDLPVYSLKSNLIDKSPPVRSIARTLSQNDSCTEVRSQYPLKTPVVLLDAEEERQEWIFLVQTLLAAAKLGNKLQSDTFLARCHSLESPLDPSLRDNYLGLNDKETLHEANRRQRRSLQKRVFDCVNAVLVELALDESDTWKSRPSNRVHDQRSIFDSVWTQMEWLSGEVSCVFGESWENNSLVVERLVRNDVIGKGWVHQSRMVLDNFLKEIESKVLEDLVQEAVEEFTVSLR